MIPKFVAILVLASALNVASANAQSTSIWEGTAGLQPLAPARVYAGAHRIGDAVAEIELANRRTGRIATPIQLTSDQHGTLTIVAGTPVAAERLSYAVVGGGEPARAISGGIEWCTVTGDLPRVCIRQPTGLEALLAARTNETPRIHYIEYAAPARLSGREWSGDEPDITEEPVDVGPSTRRLLVVRDFTHTGVTLGIAAVTGEHTSDAPLGVVPFDTVLRDDTRFPGALLRISRVRGQQDVVFVQAVE